MKRAPTRDRKTISQPFLIEFRLELYDTHGRRGGQIVGANRLDQRLSEPWKFRIQFELDPGGEKSKALH